MNIREKNQVQFRIKSLRLKDITNLWHCRGSIVFMLSWILRWNRIFWGTKVDKTQLVIQCSNHFYIETKISLLTEVLLFAHLLRGTACKIWYVGRIFMPKKAKNNRSFDKANIHDINMQNLKVYGKFKQRKVKSLEEWK